MSDFDAEREANIARNRELLEKLAVSVPVLKSPSPTKRNGPKPKPVQPHKRVKQESAPSTPLRTSARLRKPVIDPNESPTMRRKRQREEEVARKEKEAEKLEAEENAKQAKRPRHQDLDISTLGEQLDSEELSTLTTTLDIVVGSNYPERISTQDAFIFDDDEEEEAEVEELRNKLKGLKVVSRAKVTQNRVYSAAYHPEVTKDLIFFGDKHGQLGIWDAQAPPDEVSDEDGDVASAENSEGGKYWRLQLHWPAISQSSISGVKFDPIDSHIVYTSAYDHTVRQLSFSSGVSRELFSLEDWLLCSFDIRPQGYELWVSDTGGGVTHLDLREHKSRARRYPLSESKIGTVSLNPVNTNFLLTASNNRCLRVWDVRKLSPIKGPKADTGGGGPTEIDGDVMETYLSSKSGKACFRGEWRHDKSVSSAYWDPRGRSIVSTSYDDAIRLWDFKPNVFAKDAPFPSLRPMVRIKHDCQTGRWLTILKAQWSMNPDVYPHFTIGNMKHSLDIYSCKGDLLAQLRDKEKITAVQAVTCSHPSIVERVASGNASGRCVLWAPSDD